MTGVIFKKIMIIKIKENPRKQDATCDPRLDPFARKNNIMGTTGKT